MKTIHINCDLGEGGKYDALLMPHISACNIACGGHAGNATTMLKTVKLAMENNVEIGAHPSYPDIENFGRRSLKISETDLKKSIQEQLFSLHEIVVNQGEKLTHFKPHGALYNDAAKDEKVAQIVLDAILESELNLALYAPENSVISKLARGKIFVKFEAFADRNYNPDFSLVSRANSNALITKKEDVFKHLISMFSKGEIVCENGKKISSKAATF
ncbi:LamB/YcsF family protein, partial [Gillisia marina]|uniref:LamB/YcsF family protein n=1 Tax=Gillisia marina TaxID=1167637 RepID=UPI000299D375